MSKEVNLKPCPFCGGEATLRHTKDREGKMYGELWIVSCEARSCYIRPCTSFYTSEEEAIEAWNTRV